MPVSDAIETTAPPGERRPAPQAEAGPGALALSGDWTATFGETLERCAAAIGEAGRGRSDLVIDLAAVDRLDTAGAVVIDRARRALAASGTSVALRNAQPAHETLMREIASAELKAARSRGPHPRRSSPGFFSAHGPAKTMVGNQEETPGERRRRTPSRRRQVVFLGEFV